MLTESVFPGHAESIAESAVEALRRMEVVVGDERWPGKCLRGAKSTGPLKQCWAMTSLDAGQAADLYLR